MNEYFHPVLTNQAAKNYEKTFFEKKGSDEWSMMQNVGARLGEQIYLDTLEVGGFSVNPSILLVLGKGHNAGDAVLAVDHLTNKVSKLKLSVLWGGPYKTRRPALQKAWNNLIDRKNIVLREKTVNLSDSVADLVNWLMEENHYQLALDGLLGMSFSPPLRTPIDKIILAFNEYQAIVSRVAVDLPSGITDPASDGLSMKATVTYATGIVKSAVVQRRNREKVGRLRYLDTGFWNSSQDFPKSPKAVLSPKCGSFLNTWRNPNTHKKHYGHLLIVGGSRAMPGALLLTAKAALRSGLGLVTVAVPESILPAVCGQVPEAMWLPLPETEEGTLALEGMRDLKSISSSINALLMGPGLGNSEETTQLVVDFLQEWKGPFVLDASGLTPLILPVLKDREKRGFAGGVLTPHMGEYRRIIAPEGIDPESDKDMMSFSSKHHCLVLRKDSISVLTDGKGLIYQPYGGPILARGGSGDILAGLIGGRVAIHNQSSLASVSEGWFWHGKAADYWARDRGAEGVNISELLEYLPNVRQNDHWE